MKASPGFECLRRFIDSRCARLVRLSGVVRLAVMVGPCSLRSVVMPGQVDERTANLRGSQGEESAHRIGPHVSQRAIQPQEGVLKDVIRFLPAAKLRIITEHAASQL